MALARGQGIAIAPNHVASVEDMVTKCIHEGDPEAMVSAVVDIVALLSAPRCESLMKNFVTSGSVMHYEPDRSSAKAQKRLRAALLRLLIPGQNYTLDLQDTGTQRLLRVPLQKLWDLIERKVSDGANSKLSSHEQWAQLAHVLASVGMPVGLENNNTETYGETSWRQDQNERLLQVVALRLGKDLTQYPRLTMKEWDNIAKEMDIGRSANSCKAHFRTLVDPRYQRLEKRQGQKHTRGLIARMAKDAMSRLGGEATCSELIDFCKRDPKMQELYAHSLNTRLTKIVGTTKELQVWEATVSTNIHKHFDKTEKRRGRHAVYASRPH